MSTNVPGSLESDPMADASFTYHREPAPQGGQQFARCRGCGREILTGIGTDRLEHAPGCPNA